MFLRLRDMKGEYRIINTNMIVEVEPAWKDGGEYIIISFAVTGEGSSKSSMRVHKVAYSCSHEQIFDKLHVSY